MYECESYAHFYSKKVVKDWLTSKYDKDTQVSSFDVFEWYSDYSDKDHGIRLEYPIIEFKSNYLGMDPAWTEYPDLKKIKDAGRQVSCIIDLVILDKNKPKYGLEVVHKHECSRSKLITLAKLNQIYNFQVYEVSASWILDQIKRPKSFGTALDKKN